MGFEARAVVCLLAFTQGVCWAFNIGTKNAQLYEVPEDAQFGYTVQQYTERSSQWLLVGAPKLLSSGSRTGDLYKCPVPLSTGVCEKLRLSDGITFPDVLEVKENMSLGLSLAVNPRTKDIMSCGPLWAYECGSLYFPVGACAVAGSNLQQIGKPFAPTMTDCRSFMDIVIVLDGSNSIYPWSAVQNFLQSILLTFSIGPGQMQVGIMQYGNNVKSEIKLNQFNNLAQLVKVAKDISQLGGDLTNTAMAINEARRTAFLPQNGGRTNASKVMIVVTDGESSDYHNLPAAIDACNKDEITRFGIAVLGYYTNSKIDVDKFRAEIRSIASIPTEKHYFDVANTEALVNITKTLGERIYSLEGTSEISTFDMEMSEAGFSILPVEDGWLLGAVGAFDWLGTVLHVPNMGGTGTVLLPRASLAAEFPSLLKNHNTYLGYSLASASLQDKTLYIAGAPRYNHTGKVIVFGITSTSRTYTIRQSLLGNQIGSYFGGEVCAMDVDGDSVSDVLLVAAPMYMDSSRRETGRVSLYTFSPQGVLEWSAHLSPAESQESRFGSALAAVPDLNQDGAGELVVGAPLEDERQGAIYLFHGHGRSLRTSPVQRIAASALGLGRLQYFGRALHGALDMDNSNIADIAVGANGKALLLWSRAIVRVSVTVAFYPDKINMMDKTCKGMGQDAVCVTAPVCFRASVRPARRSSSPLELVYNVTLDPVRSVSRAHFIGGLERSLQGDATIQPSSQFCRDCKFYVMELADIVKPLELRVDLALKEPDQGPVLDADEPSSINFQLPFTKDCGTDEHCETDLVLTLDHDVKGTRMSPYVVRPERKKHVVSIALENRGENAYNTKLNFTYSTNQELRNIEAEDGDVSVDCSESKDSPYTQLCNIGPPVFKAGAKVKIQFRFEFSRKIIKKEAVFDVKVESDSDETAQQLENNKDHISIPLQYEADIILFRDSNLAQVEVTDRPQKLDVIKGFDDIGPELKYTFKVQNLGFRLPEEMKLTISLPTQTTQNNHLLYVTSIHSSSPEMMRCDGAHGIDPLNIVKQPYQLQQTVEEDLSHVEELTCTDASCTVFTCTLGRLDEGKDAWVTVTSRFWNTTFARATFKSVKLLSQGRLQFDPSSFLIIPKGNEERTVVLEVTRLEIGEVPVGIIIGSIIGGLLLLALLIFGLWKLGFFRRRYKQLLQDASPEGGETNPLSDMTTLEE